MLFRVPVLIHLVLLGVLLSFDPASASLIGDDIDLELAGTANGNPIGLLEFNRIVSDDAEPDFDFNFTFFDPEAEVDIEIDVAADTFQIVFTGGPDVATALTATITLLDFDWRDSSGAVVPGTLVDATQTSGPDAVASLIVGDDEVTVVFEPLDLMTNEEVVFDFALETTHADPVIPEPATLTLFGMGLAGLAVRRTRSRS